MIVRAGLGIESGSLFVEKEGADLPFLDETVKVAIHGAETDPRQLLVNPSVDLVDERVRVIALESGEHLLQLTCSTLASSSPHRLPRILAIGPSDVSGCGLSDEEFTVKRFPAVPFQFRSANRPIIEALIWYPHHHKIIPAPVRSEEVFAAGALEP